MTAVARRFGCKMAVLTTVRNPFQYRGWAGYFPTDAHLTESPPLAENSLVAGEQMTRKTFLR